MTKKLTQQEKDDRKADALADDSADRDPGVIARAEAYIAAHAINDDLDRSIQRRVAANPRYPEMLAAALKK